MVSNRTVGKKKPLRMTCRFEAPHRSLPLPRRLVGIFRTIIQSFMLPMLDATQDLSCRAIASEFFRDDHP